VNSTPHVNVSVVIPCYCCVETIERAVVSLMVQTVLPKELILVDDASPDHFSTLNTLEKIKKHHDGQLEIKVISLGDNGGAAFARNAGWNAATQPYIAFLDADDSWHPQKIEIQYGIMSECLDAALCGHSRQVIKKASDKKAGSIEKPGYRILTKSNALWSNPFATSTIMLKRDIPFRFDAGKRYSEDYLLWLRIIFSGYKAMHISADLAYYYKNFYGVSGLSASLWRMELGELDCYRDLYRRRLIGRGLFLAVLICSLMKYVRRVLITLYRRTVAAD